MLIYDADDLTDKDQWFIDQLHELKAINPLLKCTLFAIPYKCSDVFTESLPPWIQLGYHGYLHESNYEWSDISYERLREDLDYWGGQQTIKYRKQQATPWVKLIKAPGWQISRAGRAAIRDSGWTLADNPLYKQDRLPGEHIYDFSEYGNDAWHGHVNPCGGNGLLESWDKLVERIKDEQDFRFISEVIEQ